MDNQENESFSDLEEFLLTLDPKSLFDAQTLKRILAAVVDLKYESERITAILMKIRISFTSIVNHHRSFNKEVDDALENITILVDDVTKRIPSPSIPDKNRSIQDKSEKDGNIPF